MSRRWRTLGWAKGEIRATEGRPPISPMGASGGAFCAQSPSPEGGGRRVLLLFLGFQAQRPGLITPERPNLAENWRAPPASSFSKGNRPASPTACTTLLAQGRAFAGLGPGSVVLQVLVQLLVRAPQMPHDQAKQRRADARRLQQSDAKSNLPLLQPGFPAPRFLRRRAGLMAAGMGRYRLPLPCMKKPRGSGA
jgi:hypothetical protein